MAQRARRQAGRRATIRHYLAQALSPAGITSPSGEPLYFTPHDFRRLFITDAIMHGMPPHIAQLVAGHEDINTTMGYNAVYPQEVINGHRAFITRRRSLRPAEEYRTPTDEEWEEFLGLPVNCTSSGSLTGHPGPVRTARLPGSGLVC